MRADNYGFRRDERPQRAEAWKDPRPLSARSNVVLQSAFKTKASHVWSIYFGPDAILLTEVRTTNHGVGRHAGEISLQAQKTVSFCVGIQWTQRPDKLEFEQHPHTQVINIFEFLESP